MYERVGTNDWPGSSVFDLARWKNGLAFKNIDFSETGRPVIKIAELKNGITQQTARTMADYEPSVFVTPGDMLFSWSGNPDTSIDVFRWEGEEGWLNQHIFKVTPREGISAEFLFFLLKWLKPRFAEIARNKQTTGLGHVTIQDLKRMQVAVPEVDEQAAIIEIIGPIQEKIELNRRMNETLEAMARAIFQDWFVAFGPTRAKMEGRAPYLAEDISNHAFLSFKQECIALCRIRENHDKSQRRCKDHRGDQERPKKEPKRTSRRIVTTKKWIDSDKDELTPKEEETQRKIL
jgi:type I restriction enzyme S subunit